MCSINNLEIPNYFAGKILLKLTQFFYLLIFYKGTFDLDTFMENANESYASGFNVLTRNGLPNKKAKPKT
jgi:hypothetical protein